MLWPIRTGPHRSPSGRDVYTWADGNEQVFVLGGSVLVQQDQTYVWSNRAVVWVDVEAYRKRIPFAVAVYADENGGKQVAIEAKGRPRQEVPATVVEFAAPRFGWVRGRERQESLADSSFYKKALAARGKPAPAPEVIPSKGGFNRIEPAQFNRIDQSVPPSPGVPKTLPAPGEPDGKAPAVTSTTVIPVPISETRTIWISPRTNRPFNVIPSKKDKDKETAYFVTGGIKLLAKFSTGSIRSIEVEADQAIIWLKDAGPGGCRRHVFRARGKGGEGTELYLSGNVVIRYGAPKDVTVTGVQTQARTVRAERVYYDVDHHKAIAMNADVEYMREGYVNTGHIVAGEFHQLSSTEFTALLARMHASRLPSDPGVVLSMERADVYREPRRSDKRVRHRIQESPDRRSHRGRRSERQRPVEVMDTPVFWWPYVRRE